jgi:hypothetical protein
VALVATAGLSSAEKGWAGLCDEWCFKFLPRSAQGGTCYSYKGVVRKEAVMVISYTVKGSVSLVQALQAEEMSAPCAPFPTWHKPWERMNGDGVWVGFSNF